MTFSVIFLSLAGLFTAATPGSGMSVLTGINSSPRRETRAVGCGKALHNGQLIVVCNYDPAGNVEGERPF